jgi:hypothetical protein
VSRTLGRGDVTFVPGDGQVDDAMWSGTVVGRGPFSTAVARVAESLPGSGSSHAIGSPATSRHEARARTARSARRRSGRAA